MAKNNIPAVVWIEKEQRWRLYGTKNGVRKKFSSSNPSAKTGPAEYKKKYLRWLESEDDKINVRFEKVWSDFIYQSSITTSKSNTRQREVLGRLYLLPKLKNKKTDNITNLDYQKCINEAFHTKDLSYKTLCNLHGVISAFSQFARDGQYSDLRAELKIPRKAEKGKRKILQPDKIKRLLLEPNDMKLINPVKLIVMTGLRRSEALGLQWQDINNGILTIQRANTAEDGITKGKNDNAIRCFHLTSYTQKVLDVQKDILEKQGLYHLRGWVFPDILGEKMNPRTFIMRWSKYSKENNYNCSIHELRHTFVSISKNALPKDMLKRIVGHSKSMDTTGIYGHLVDGELEVAKDLLDEVFNKIMEV